MRTTVNQDMLTALRIIRVAAITYVAKSGFWKLIFSILNLLNRVHKSQGFSGALDATNVLVGAEHRGAGNQHPAALNASLGVDLQWR